MIPRSRILLKHTYRVFIAVSSWLLYYPYIIRFRVHPSRSKRLHVGCGRNRFPGWINADIHPAAQLIIYLERRLPLKAESLNRIYSEHVLEHVTYPICIKFLREARRVLEPGGVIRIAMPDLDDLVDRYTHDWRKLDWVNWPEFSFIQTKAEMLNIAFRWWGHCYLYNREEIARALNEAGFVDIYFAEPGHSAYPDLCGLETRPDSRLIVEAIK